MTHVKICCIHSVDEATLAVQYGASAVGLVSAMPSGPGIIRESMIAEIAGSIAPPTERFLLTSQTDPNAIAAQQARCGVDTIQLCDALCPGDHAALKRLLPKTSLIQVIHVQSESARAEAKQSAQYVDKLLLDSGNPSGTHKQLGGTGRTHNWAISAAIVQETSIPVYLAGGLNADNVASAIQTVRPYGVDVCSGVRTNGSLDEEKLRAFMDAVRSAKQHQA